MNKIVVNDISTIINGIENHKEYHGKNFLVTGVNGMICSYFCLTLLRLNEIYDAKIKIFAIARNIACTQSRFEKDIQNGSFVIIEGDLSEPNMLKLPQQMDYIFHAASQTSPRHFKNDPVGTLQVNSLGTNFLLDYAVVAGVKGFLFLSTREIYGENYNDKKFVSENGYGPLDPTSLRSCYPESKRFGEACCVAYRHQFALNCKIARIAHTYGPLMKIDDGRIVGEFISKVISNQDIVLNSDGSSLLSLTYISDLIIGLFVLMQNQDTFVLNISNDKEILSVKEFAQLMSNISEDTIVKYSNLSESEKPAYLKAQPALLSSDGIKKYGWDARVNTLDGIARTINYFRGLSH